MLSQLARRSPRSLAIAALVAIGALVLTVSPKPAAAQANPYCFPPYYNPYYCGYGYNPYAYAYPYYGYGYGYGYPYYGGYPFFSVGFGFGGHRHFGGHFRGGHGGFHGGHGGHHR